MNWNPDLQSRKRRDPDEILSIAPGPLSFFRSLPPSACHLEPKEFDQRRQVRGEQQLHVQDERKLDLEQDRHRELDTDVDERDEDGIDRGKDVQVDAEAELDNPFAACSGDFHDDADDQLHDHAEPDVDGTRELGDNVDAHLDVRNDLGDDRLAVTVRGIVALVEEVNVNVEFDVEVDQGLVALVAHVAASDERVAQLTGSGSYERTGGGDGRRSGAGEHAERQQEERERGEAREGRLELHGGGGKRWRAMKELREQ